MKRVIIVATIVFGACANGNVGADCYTDQVTLGTYDLGSWSNSDSSIVVSEPLVGSTDWIYDHDTLKSKYKEFLDDCDKTAAKLIERVSQTFPAHASNAEIVYDQSARDCKDEFGHRYDNMSNVLCGPDD